MRILRRRDGGGWKEERPGYDDPDLGDHLRFGVDKNMRDGK